jgi:hypothetical protein
MPFLPNELQVVVEEKVHALQKRRKEIAGRHQKLRDD